ncbi:MAG: hypothetical protein ACM3PZ_02015 [Bacillota bacterium]
MESRLSMNSLEKLVKKTGQAFCRCFRINTVARAMLFNSILARVIFFTEAILVGLMSLAVYLIKDNFSVAIIIATAITLLGVACLLYYLSKLMGALLYPTRWKLSSEQRQRLWGDNYPKLLAGNICALDDDVFFYGCLVYEPYEEKKIAKAIIETPFVSSAEKIRGDLDSILEIKSKFTKCL